MLRNYLLTTVRSFRRHKLFTGIHIAGLSIGMACCILIALFVQDQLRYSSYHSRGHRVYRVLRESSMAGSGEKMETGTSSAITPAVMRDFPEVEAAARLLSGWWPWMSYGDDKFRLNFALGDAALLDMFDISLVRGDRATALREPNTAVVAEGTAEFLFHGEDPLGKVIRVHDDKLGGSYLITGVMANLPPHSHVHFDVLTAHPSAETSFAGVFDSWSATVSWRPFTNYIMLREGVPAAQLEAQLPDFEARYLGDEVAASMAYRLQPVNRIHLYSQADFGMGDERGIEFVARLALIGLVVLLIACVNFVNLATAQAAGRSREVGLRKVIGAQQLQLMRQYLGEAVLLAIVSLILACVIALVALPWYNQFMNANLEFGLTADLVTALLAITLVVGLFAGGYPALVLSRFQPVETLKGQISSRGGGRAFRRALVVAQFAASATLIIASVVVYQQTRYMTQKDLGHDTSLLINLSILGYRLEASTDVVKRDFLSHPRVLSATASWPPPGSWGYAEYHSVQPEGEAEGEWEMQVIGIDSDFLETFGVELVAGRNLRASRDADTEAYLLNETAARQLGWDEPIGKRFDWLSRKPGYVVGIVRDFHTQSLHHPIEPLVMHHWIRRTLTVRIDSEDVPGTLDDLKEKWRRFLPDVPFDYWFLDEHLARYYEDEAHLNQTCTLFSVLAVFVACLGLFGLSTHASVQRTKEIGIRKAVGASASSIASLLSRDFTRLVIIANVLACPLAYHLMSTWLARFPYRISLSPLPFLLCMVATLATALVTVCYQSIKTALTDPVEALHWE